MGSYRAALFPRWRGLIHFTKVLKKGAFQDSNHWEDMSRVRLLPFGLLSLTVLTWLIIY